MKMKILVLLLMSVGTVQAKTALNTVAACSSSELHHEPLAERNFYVESGVKSGINASLFNPDSVKDLFSRSGINRAGVSSSHIVNLVAEGMEKLNHTEAVLVRKGELLPVIEGVTYGEGEYARRQDSVAKAREKYFLPMLKNLYNTYLVALQQDHNKDLNAKNADPKATQAFYALAVKQRDSLNALIKKYRPSIIQKMGEIDAVDPSKDLPLSYKDGYVVKIRFKRAGAPYHVTVYPHMLLNLVQNDDDRFLSALNRWKDFTESQWRAANNLKKSRLSYSWARVMEWVGGAASTDDLVRKEPLMKKAYAQASEDVRQAKFVNTETAQLTPDEVYFLFDVMKALRQNDIPQCSAQLKRLNDSMAKLLKGKKSSAQLSGDERAKAESFANHVSFYQDQYLSFSSAASAKLGEKR